MNAVKIFYGVSLMIVATVTRAQDHIIEGNSPNFHLTHQVAAKETWYSVGRMYNVGPKELASYNKLSTTHPLEVGQQVSVPLTSANFSQDDEHSDAKAVVPIYHIVQPKEWLYRISLTYNKVAVDKLEKWNGIGKDGAKPGTKLIVGYLKLADATAATAATTTSGTPAPNPSSAPAKKPLTDKPKATPRPVAATTNPVSDSTSHGAVNAGGSYFKNQFEDNGRNSSGIAGIFKSTSGWSDGKYYALISNVPIGTIIKVTMPATTKSVYAKVLGELPDMKESEGLALRISDAAARELGSPESKFTVSVRY